MIINLKEEERIDDLHRKGYQIIQNKKRFCFGMDAVLLSGFATVKEGEKVLDLGTGTGIIPILLEAKTKGKQFVGLEIQEEVAEMANRSVLLNDLQNKVQIQLGDIKEASKLFGGASFDVVTTNPPYMKHEHGLQNGDNSKAISRHEILCDIEDVIREGAKVLKPRGRFYMVHRPNRLTDIFEQCIKYKLQPSKIRLVHPYKNKSANMVLLEAIRGGKCAVNVESPLIVYEETGVYTKEIYDIYGYE